MINVLEPHTRVVTFLTNALTLGQFRAPENLTLRQVVVTSTANARVDFAISAEPLPGQPAPDAVQTEFQLIGNFDGALSAERIEIGQLAYPLETGQVLFFQATAGRVLFQLFFS